MSDAQAFGFGQFIPGYDFFQQLSQSSKGAALPPFSSWVAPTVSVEEIDKRIEELKAVQFWLDQNGKALAATVQALQVQKMTLSTLKGMNVNLQEFAQAVGATQSGDLSNWPMGAAQKAAAAQRQASAATQAAADTPPPEPAKPTEPTGTAPHPMAEQAQQWWGSLTQQFQHIAQQVLQDPAQKNAMAQAASMASDFTKVAAQTASDMMRQAVSQATTAAQTAAAGFGQPHKLTTHDCFISHTRFHAAILPAGSQQKAAAVGAVAAPSLAHGRLEAPFLDFICAERLHFGFLRPSRDFAFICTVGHATVEIKLHRLLRIALGIFLRLLFFGAAGGQERQ